MQMRLTFSAPTFGLKRVKLGTGESDFTGMEADKVGSLIRKDVFNDDL